MIALDLFIDKEHFINVAALRESLAAKGGDDIYAAPLGPNLGYRLNEPLRFDWSTRLLFGSGVVLQVENNGRLEFRHRHSGISGGQIHGAAEESGIASPLDMVVVARAAADQSINGFFMRDTLLSGHCGRALALHGAEVVDLHNVHAALDSGTCLATTSEPWIDVTDSGKHTASALTIAGGSLLTQLGVPLSIRGQATHVDARNLWLSTPAGACITLTSLPPGSGKGNSPHHVAIHGAREQDVTVDMEIRVAQVGLMQHMPHHLSLWGADVLDEANLSKVRWSIYS